MKVEVHNRKQIRKYVVQSYVQQDFAHLEAVLLSHDSLCLPLIAGLPRCSDALRGQVSPCCPPLSLSQVNINYLQTYLVAHKVLQLKSETMLVRM